MSVLVHWACGESSAGLYAPILPVHVAEPFQHAMQAENVLSCTCRGPSWRQVRALGSQNIAGLLILPDIM